MSEMFVAALINSTFRYATPILFATLGYLVCIQCNVFNVALEGQMLAASFAAIVINYYTHNVVLCLLGAVAAGVIVSSLVAIFQVRLGAKDMVVGTSVNLLSSSVVCFLMQIIFGTRGTIQGMDMISLPKVNVDFLSGIPFLYRMLENLSYLDYLCYVFAIGLFIYLYKSVSGFHLRSVGINKAAAESLGIKAERTQILAVLFSGLMCGLGGIALSMGNVTMFVEGMTSGRGFIAMGASSMAQAHPLFAVASSLFFGGSLALSKAMQSYINSYITVALPYFCTVAIIAVFGLRGKGKSKK